MYKFLVLLAFVPAILARTPVRECTGVLPLPTAVFFGSRAAPCTAPPCDISRGSGVGVTYVDFSTRSAATSILPRIRARVFGITITQELPADIAANPCGILEAPHSCPLAAGQAASYRLALPVDPTTPLVTSDTEISLLGDNNEVIFCYQLQTRVVA